VAVAVAVADVAAVLVEAVAGIVEAVADIAAVVAAEAATAGDKQKLVGACLSYGPHLKINSQRTTSPQINKKAAIYTKIFKKWGQTPILI